VLIPRWLRRDSSSSESAGEPVSEDLTTAKPDPTAAGEELARRSRRESRREDLAPAARPETRAEARRETRAGAQRETRAGAQRETRAGAQRETRAGAQRETRAGAEVRTEALPGESRRPLDQEHKRVLSARRRLLGLLLILFTGSAGLAFTKMAAWWVVLPPTIMLLSYMALLREAAKADAERRELARLAPARARSSVASPPAASPAAGPAPAPDAEVIAISASLGPAGEEFYDQYADAKLRAVGDLARARLDRQDLGPAEREFGLEGKVLVRG
jgi:hypothetical protein